MNSDYEVIEIPFPHGSDGYAGRECPECEEYFKIVFGTGLEGTTHCYCPYCGYKGDHDEFYTQEQNNYIESVALNRLTTELLRGFKQIERYNRPRSAGLFNIEFRVEGKPTPIRYPQEFSLETYVDCSNCTLKYAIYGVYAFCPDCGRRNAHQILETSLDIAIKVLQLTDTSEPALLDTLISNALTSVVASFDGYGREICRTYASKASNFPQAKKIRFQNLAGAQTQVRQCFSFDMASSLTTPEWEMAIRCFQKRHVLEHNSGVIDDDYVKKANDPMAILGRKVVLTADEVRQLIHLVRRLGKHIVYQMEQLP